MNNPVNHIPVQAGQPTHAQQPNLLEVRNLRKYFPIVKGLLRRAAGYVYAVDDVSFEVKKGETLALVGESGCGKTTAARCILRAYRPTSGQILLRLGDERIVDISGLSRRGLYPVRRHMQMIFQDPSTSLNPRMTLLDNIGEPLLVNGMKDRGERVERVKELLRLVGLRPEYMSRYPHAFSGGQRQRIGIARALALNPSLIVADEPVSALDVSVQAQILNLLLDVQSELSLTYLFVSHDLAVVKRISDRVAVMYVGKIVELAPVERLFYRPRHPYTEALLSAVPSLKPGRKRTRVALRGEIADAANPPGGCYFHPRCLYAIDRCKSEEPPLLEIESGHFVSCHRADELQLSPADLHD